MTNVWISAAGLCGATIIGSILGFGIKELPHKWNDTLLGYCAGVMLAASTLGLIVPAFESTATPWWLVAFGVMAGALFLNVLASSDKDYEGYVDLIYFKETQPCGSYLYHYQ